VSAALAAIDVWISASRYPGPGPAHDVALLDHFDEKTNDLGPLAG